MSLNPEQDSTLEALLGFLRDKLNASAEAYYLGQEAPIQQAVVAIIAGQTDLASVKNLPLLMGYRTSFQGPTLEDARVTLDYFVQMTTTGLPKQSAIFTWAARTIGEALTSYNGEGDQCLEVLGEDPSASIRYAQVQASGQSLTFPFLRVQFLIRDYEAVGP